MPTIEGKEGRAWIDAYVAKPGKMQGVMKGLRALVKKTLPGCEEYVNPWKIPSFDSEGTVCGFMTGKEHVTFIFLRGGELPDPQGLLEGTGKHVRHVKVRTAADVKKPALKKLIVEAAKLNKRKPMKGMKVDMNKRRGKEGKRERSSEVKKGAISDQIADIRRLRGGRGWSLRDVEVLRLSSSDSLRMTGF